MAIFRLAAWRICMRGARIAHTAASYGEGLVAVKKPGNARCSRATTGSR